MLTARSSLFGVELTKETAEAFNQYIVAFEAKSAPRFKGDHFRKTDATPKQREDLLHGAILVEPASGNGETELKAGLIQDWIGGVFIPSATLADALAVVQDYPRDKEYYAPDIQDAKVRSRQGNATFDVAMRIVKSKFLITDVLNTEYDVRFIPVDARRVYCRSASIRIAEVANAGKPDEHELPVGSDRGLLWRMNGYWFFEQVNGGVFIEYESITLSRNVPFGMGHVLGPILHNVPAESLRSSLDKTRKAIVSVRQNTRSSR